jgi:hypothetical protein
MTMSDDVKVGDRFEWICDDSASAGTVWTVVALEGECECRISNGGTEKNNHYRRDWLLEDTKLWKRLPREEAKPTSEATYTSYARVKYTVTGGSGTIGTGALTGGWTTVKVDAAHQAKVKTPEAATCRSGCTPAAPCRTEMVCPAWREDAIAVAMRERKPLVLRSLLDDQGTHEPSTSGFGGGFVSVWKK